MAGLPDGADLRVCATVRVEGRARLVPGGLPGSAGDGES